MIEFVNFIVGICNRLISMMASDVFTPHLGAPFLYFALAFFCIWVVTNVFILRPLVGGSLVDSFLQAHNNQVRAEHEEAKRTALQIQTTYRYGKDGKLKGGTESIFDPTTNTTEVHDL